MISFFMDFVLLGEALSLKVEKVLFHGKSEYQSIMVFQVLTKT